MKRWWLPKLTIRQKNGIKGIFALMDGSTCTGMTRSEWVDTAARQIFSHSAGCWFQINRTAVNKYIKRLERTKMFRDWLVRCNIKRIVGSAGIEYSL